MSLLLTKRSTYASTSLSLADSECCSTALIGVPRAVLNVAAMVERHTVTLCLLWCTVLELVTNSVRLTGKELTGLPRAGTAGGKISSAS